MLIDLSKREIALINGWYIWAHDQSKMIKDEIE